MSMLREEGKRGEEKKKRKKDKAINNKSIPEFVLY